MRADRKTDDTIVECRKKYEREIYRLEITWWNRVYEMVPETLRIIEVSSVSATVEVSRTGYVMQKREVERFSFRSKGRRDGCLKCAGRERLVAN